MNAELNQVVQRQVFKMIDAKEAYDLAVSKGKLKYTSFYNLPCFGGLTIQEAIEALNQFEQELPDGYEIGAITSGHFDEGDYIECCTYESDEDYELRLSQLRQVLENERKELASLERAKEIYEFESNKLTPA